MADQQTAVRHNILAIVLAAVVCFLFEAAWYSFFMETWLSGIGHTKEWLVSTGVNPALQYATALVSGAILAMAISTVTQLTGALTMWRGMVTGAGLWLGVVATTWTTEYVFELRPWGLWAVNGGFWLVGMVLMGAIVGAWKAKVKA